MSTSMARTSKTLTAAADCGEHGGRRDGRAPGAVALDQAPRDEHADPDGDEDEGQRERRVAQPVQDERRLVALVAALGRRRLRPAARLR